MADNLALKIIIGAKDQASSVLKSVGGALGKIGTAAVAAGAAVGTYLSGKLFADSISSAQRLEEQMGTLRGVIEATGGTAGLTAEEIDVMARRLDEATLGSAEGFRSAAAELLTFKSVGRDAFETTLMLAQDLASAGFGSVEENAKQLGKALEDPVLGLTALRRSGVSFTEEQQNLIKSLVETGRSAEAQGMILDAVAGQVGGAASAMGGGLSGAVDLVGKRFQDLKEQLGAGFLPVLSNVNNAIADMLKRMTESGQIKALGDAIAQAFQGAATAALEFVRGIDLEQLIADIQRFATTTSERVTAIGESFSSMGEIAGGVIDVLKIGWNAFAGVINAGASTITKGLALVTSGYATAVELAAKVGLASEESALKARAAADTLHEAANGYKEAFEGNSEAARAALGRVGDAIAGTADATRQLGATADEQAPKLANLFDPDVEAAAARVQDAARAYAGEIERLRLAGESTSPALERLRGELDASKSAYADAQAAAAAYANRQSELDAAQAESAASLADATAQYRAEQDRLAASGETTSAALEVLGGYLDAMQADYDAAAAAAEGFRADQQALADAQARLTQLQDEYATARAAAANGDADAAARMADLAAEITATEAEVKRLTESQRANAGVSADMADASVSAASKTATAIREAREAYERGEITLQQYGEAMAAAAAKTDTATVASKANKESTDAQKDALAQLTPEAIAAADAVGQMAIAANAKEQLDAGKISLAEYLEVMGNIATTSAASGDGVEDLGDKVKQTGDESDRAAEKIRKAKEETEEQGRAAHTSGAANEYLAGELAKTGIAAEHMAAAQSAANAAYTEAAAATAAWVKELRETQVGDTWTTGGGVALRYAQQYTEMLQEQERVALEAGKRAAEYAERLDKVAQAQASATSEYDAGSISLQQYIRSLEMAERTAGNLNDEDLADLRAAIADAKAEMDDFTSSAEDGLRSLQQEWAELNGNQAEAQQIEQQQERLAIEEQIKEAREQGNSEAERTLQQQLDLLDKIQAKERDELQSEIAAEAEREAEAHAQSADEVGRMADTLNEIDSGASVDINNNTSSSATRTIETRNINETVVTHRLEIDTAKLFGDEQAVNDFIRALERAGLRVE